MKKNIFLICCMVALQLFANAAQAIRKSSEYRNARRNGAMAEIHLRVVDDMGEFVTNASVRAVMHLFASEYSMFGTTDTNGVYVTKGKTDGNYIEFFVGKDGYYGSKAKVVYASMTEPHEVKDGKWQPYGGELKIELRKIRNPISLSPTSTGNYSYTKTLNTWVGFDLLKRDFVKPYGNGEVADFEVFFRRDGTAGQDFSGVKLCIRFVEPYAGFCQLEKAKCSLLVGPYNANSNAEYEREAEFFRYIMSKTKRYRCLFDKQKVWVVRSRCKVDENEALISANYSVITDISFGRRKGGGANFCVIGLFNPTPNDTNLEDIAAIEKSRYFFQYCEPREMK